MTRPLKKAGSSFRSWLTGAYLELDSALGDFARETAADPCWPRSNNEHVLRAHLRAHDACDRVHGLFEKAYALYVSSGFRPVSNQTDDQALRARMRTVLQRPDHLDRQLSYASKRNEIGSLLPDETDLSGPRSIQEIAAEWCRPGSRRPGSVYFIQSGSTGPVKIGFATDPGSRMRSLQTGHPEKLRVLAVVQEATQMDEKDLHSRFAHLRIQGEWFQPGSDLLAYIEEVGGA